MARRHVKQFDNHHVAVVITHAHVDIDATWLDPEEGRINAVEHISLSRDELAWVVGRVLET